MTVDTAQRVSSPLRPPSASPAAVMGTLPAAVLWDEMMQASHPSRTPHDRGPPICPPPFLTNRGACVAGRDTPGWAGANRHTGLGQGQVPHATPPTLAASSGSPSLPPPPPPARTTPCQCAIAAARDRGARYRRCCSAVRHRWGRAVTGGGSCVGLGHCSARSCAGPAERRARGCEWSDNSAHG
jgi:hypothetical protein